MGIEAWALAPDAVCVLTAVAAAIIDVRCYRIPNWLTATGAILGVLANVGLAMAIGSSAAWRAVLLPMLIGGVGLGVVSLALSSLGWMGMGDVKLFAACGFCVRWPNALALFLYSSLAGAVLAMGVAMHRGRVRQVAKNLKDPAALQARDSGHRMPYGVAILAGVLWAVIARHLPGLSLL